MKEKFGMIGIIKSVLQKVTDSKDLFPPKVGLSKV